jgi:hypothetical protein
MYSSTRHFLRIFVWYSMACIWFFGYHCKLTWNCGAPMNCQKKCQLYPTYRVATYIVAIFIDNYYIFLLQNKNNKRLCHNINYRFFDLLFLSFNQTKIRSFYGTITAWSWSTMTESVGNDIIEKYWCFFCLLITAGRMF